MKREKPTHLDLFSGIGGFALAAGRAGFATVGFAEVDEYCSAVLRKHWPGVRNYGDVRRVPRVRCDVLTAGVPCQPASCAGTRRGAADDRWLWDEALRVTARCKPLVAIYENPPGIISVELGCYAFGVEDLDGAIAFGEASAGVAWAEIDGHRVLGLHHVQGDFEGLGYSIQPIVVPACAVDAKHRRDRVWIVAYRNEWRRQGAGLPVRREGEVVADAGGVQSRNGEQSAGNHEAGLRSEAGADQAFVSDARCALLQEWQRFESLEPQKPACWLAEPAVGRVADGISRRVDRLRGLGNAIVPQVAEVIFRAIGETLNRES